MSSPNFQDTIDVRPDEKFDEGKLANFLAQDGRRDILGVSDRPFAVRQFGGGMANLTYQLDFGNQQFVLRRPPLGPVAASAHDMGREFKVLSKLYKEFDLAPRAFLFCDDTDIIGAPFFVMERRYGNVIRQTIPEPYRSDPDAGRKMSLALINALADFHAVDYAELGLSDLGKPEGFVTRQIEGWYKRWHKAKEHDLEMMDKVYQWLSENKPTRGRASLLHNDYKLDNVMVHAEDAGRLVAIFDWDMCTLGDSLIDLGSLLAYWTDDDDPPYMRMLSTRFLPIGTHQFMSRAELVQQYAARSGRDVGEIGFYHALGLYRLTVILAQIYIRYVRGQTQDKRFAALGELLPLMAQAAWDVAQKQD